MNNKGILAASIVVILALCIISIVPTVDGADDNITTSSEMEFGDFLNAVENSYYDYDGQGVTVKWKPSSACTDDRPNHECKVNNAVSDGNNAQRIQAPNAQYQIFSGTTDVKIANVNFVFEPADFTLCMNSSWGGSATADEIRNAEFQFQNTNDVSFTNCTFDKVIVSPFSCKGTTTITGCSFSEVYDAYAIKDIYSENATIEYCEFTNCGGAIYFEGDSTKGALTISDNTFTNIDSVKWAAEGKAGTRGLIQLSAAGDYSKAVFNISGNSSDNDAALLRLLNDSVDVSKISLEDNSEIDGPLLTSNSNHIQIGDNYYASFEEAVEAMSSMNGDVTVIINGNLDLTKVFDESANNNIEYDLSTSIISSLTIQGSNDASILTGVDGHYIDGENGNPRCPVLNFSLPNDAALKIEDITFEDDLWIDNDSGSVTFTECTFHGAISVYPQSVEVTFYKNTFQFNGTASNFYSGNAYPVWFKIDGKTEFDLVFTNNTVTGPRGVHIENRPGTTTDITVTRNTFTLDDDGHVNKTTALQLVNTMPGEIVFTNNNVDAYMAICLYNGVTLSGTIESHDNTLSTGCKEFGTSEWSENIPEGFVESLLQARIGYTYYPSLEAALGAVANSTDKRIVLVNDVNLDEMLDIKVEGVVIDLDRHTISASESFKSTYDNDSHLINIGNENAPVKGVTIENGEIVATSKNKNPINIFDSEGIVLRDLVIDASKITKGAPLVVSSGSVTLEGELVFVGGPWDYSVNMGSGTNATRSEVSVSTEPDTVLRFNGVSAGFYADQGSETEASLTFGEGTEYYYDKTPFILLATSKDSNVDEGVYQPIDRVENPLYDVSIDVTPSDATVTIDGTVVTGDSIQLEAGSYNVSVSMPGYITQEFTLRVGSGMSNAIAVDLEVESDVPVIPPVDDDDDYVPPIYVPSDTSSSDDETVKIVACAAAAVVAAIMAAFLILGHRRD